MQGEPVFAFNLQPVLNYRKTIEEKKLAEFADMQRTLAQGRAMLESIGQEKLLIVEQLRDTQQSAFYASDVSFSLSYAEFLVAKEVKQQKIVAQIAEDVERLRLELLETVKDRKIMDILKDHKFIEFKLGMASLERKAIEEAAIQSFVRKNR
jgi:flagellar FliJ protein